MDLGFLVADRKGQREHEDGRSVETVESKWKQESDREGHCRVAAPTEKRGKTTEVCQLLSEQMRKRKLSGRLSHDR